MKRRDTRTGHAAIGAMVLVFLTLMIALPIVIGQRDNSLSLESASLMAAPGNSFAITEPIALEGLPGLVVLKGFVALDEAQAKSAVDPAAMTRLLTGGGARLILDRATIAIDGTALAAITDEDAPPVVVALSRLRFESLVLNRATIIVHRNGQRRDVVGDISAEIQNKRRAGLVIKGGFSARDEPFAVEAQIGTTGGGIRRAIKAGVKGAILSANLDGEVAFGLAPEFRGRADVAVTSTRSVLRWMGFPWPAGPGLAELKAEGQLEWTGRTAAFQKATVTLDGNTGAGTISVSAGGTRPVIDGTLAFETLDLTRYALIPGLPGLRLPGLDTAEAQRPENPRDMRLPFLKLADADVRLSASRIKLPGVELLQGAASITLRGGRLQADIAEFRLGDAQGVGQVTADANAAEPRYVVRGKLKGLDLGTAVAPLLGARALSGVGDVGVDVTAHGANLARLLGTLSGKVAVSAPGGARLGFDARILLPAPAGRPRDLGSLPALARGQTSVEKLEARIVLNSGLAFADVVEAAMGDRVIQAAGSADLSARTIDLKVSLAERKDKKLVGATVAPAASASILAAPPNAPASPGMATSQPLRLQGSWSAPRLVVGEPATPPAAGSPSDVLTHDLEWGPG